MTATELITSSRLKTFAACQRLHDLEYVQQYRPAVAAEALDFGTAMHAGLEAWWRAWQSNREAADGQALDPLADALCAIGAADLEPDAAARAEILMRGYDARWSAVMADYVVRAVEIQFEAPIGRLRGVRMAGKIDVIVQRISDGTFWPVEHKTTSADLTPASTYWQRLRMDAQVSIYFDGARALGYDVAGCIYDVIAKPEQRPLRATPEDKRKYTQGGRLYANQRDRDETAGEYKERLAEAVCAEPDRYFQRVDVVRLDSDLAAARRDLIDAAKLIRVARREGAAPRNPDQCLKYGGGKPCAFFDVCSGAASLDDETRFVKLSTAHPELST